MFSFRGRQAAVSLVEVLVALAILSTLALPMLMFLVEYSRGSAQLGDYYQILNIVEEKLDTALSLDFTEVPDGETSGGMVESRTGRHLDLRPVEVAHEIVTFRMRIEVVAVDFSAMKDSTSGQLQRARVEDGMKRIELIAEWGKKKKHSINLISYKANL
ncbi:MAG: type II secretion system protein [Candidatus Riflebacteria bacterium]|nr:type II secretion system protein [Candidatus Riflebacteria bacterium]